MTYGAVWCVMDHVDFNDESDDIAQWSDDKINAAKFTLMKRICDENNLPYRPELVAWLDRKNRR